VAGRSIPLLCGSAQLSCASSISQSYNQPDYAHYYTTVHNNQSLEIFKRRRDDINCYEVWMVGIIKGQRTDLDHFITSENYERFLRYAKTGDVSWKDADDTDIPSHKTEVAQENEELSGVVRSLTMQAFAATTRRRGYTLTGNRGMLRRNR
jgi:hypothetical protein